ncbi:MFS transporter [Streptomyces sp. ADMS]|uniref:MFS transporter n=1 Tax=Streptomyces sp. ADMS TaxID=3071415 RepID=UPI00296F88E9|nr:MFS transporter [Streptomyces sp. ADMS]MDW4905915.1 MFS transporter [Streptomyces sp. ADMS]
MSAPEKAPAAPAEETASTVRHPLRALAVVLLATFMNQFDITGVNVAIPEIQRDLGAGEAAAQWVLAGYALPFALLLVTGGRLGDLAGRRRVFLAGTVGFTLASALAGAAGTVSTLVLARVFQGASAAMMGPQVLAVLQVLVPPARRGPAMGLYAGVVGLATVGGPILGGALVQADLFGWGWRALFLVNLPIGLLAVVGALRYLGESRAPDGRRLDLTGVLLAAVTLLLFLCPLTYGRELGWPWWAWAALAASAPALWFLIAHQRRRERTGGAPLIALHLFSGRVFSAGVATTFNLAALMTGFFFVFVLFLQQGLDFGPARAGQSLLPWALGTAVASFLAIPLARRHGRRVLVAGAAIAVAGLGLLTVTVVAVGRDLSGATAAPGLLLFGIGVGLVSTPVLNVTLSGVAHADAGSASGVFSTFRQAGAAVGVAVTGGVYYAVLGDGANAGPADYEHAVVLTLLLQLAVALVTSALVFLLPKESGTQEAARQEK